MPWDWNTVNGAITGALRDEKSLLDNMYAGTKKKQE
jgi:hypothetical protein